MDGTGVGGGARHRRRDSRLAPRVVVGARRAGKPRARARALGPGARRRSGGAGAAAVGRGERAQGARPDGRAGRLERLDGGHGAERAALRARRRSAPRSRRGGGGLPLRQRSPPRRADAVRRRRNGPRRSAPGDRRSLRRAAARVARDRDRWDRSRIASRLARADPHARAPFDPGARHHLPGGKRGAPLRCRGRRRRERRVRVPPHAVHADGEGAWPTWRAASALAHARGPTAGPADRRPRRRGPRQRGAPGHAHAGGTVRLRGEHPGGTGRCRAGEQQLPGGGARRTRSHARAPGVRLAVVRPEVPAALPQGGPEHRPRELLHPPDRGRSRCRLAHAGALAHPVPLRSVVLAGPRDVRFS